MSTDPRDEADDEGVEDAALESHRIGVVRKKCASGGDRLFVTLGDGLDATRIAVITPHDRD